MEEIVISFNIIKRVLSDQECKLVGLEEEAKCVLKKIKQKYIKLKETQKSWEYEIT